MKRSIKLTHKILLAGMFVFGFAGLQADNANADGIKVCAAVYPCDQDGNVFPEYLNDTSCSEVYIQQCAIAQSNRNNDRSKHACNKEKRILNYRVESLRRQLRRADWRLNNFKRQVAAK